MAKSSRTLAALAALLVTGLLTTAWLPKEKTGEYAQSGAGDQTLAPYFVVLSDDPKLDALPLKSTAADVKIAGVVADVKVTQVYRNAGQKTLEAVYVFPGSTRAAVHAMRMTIGARVVEAKIMERQKARDTYEQAKKTGQTASLLEQQRPNVFQMNVANILPGDEIKVELNYLELLIPEDHIYEFVYPTVVGPRYTAKTAAGALDTDKWTQNPYLRQGQPPPYTFGLNVELSSGVPIDKLTSPSHAVDIKYSGQTSARITLKDEKTGGNKDFVLRYALAGGKIETGALLYPGQEENFFMLMMEPPARVKPAAVLPREYIFILDVSGSMNGFPLDTSKALMKNIIQNLKPKDYMNVLLFAGGSEVLSPSGSLPASEANQGKALGFIQSQRGSGGTNILPALEQALALPRTPGVSRIIAVLTDGYVSVESRAFHLIRDRLGEANLFAFGIGAAVNRHLIEGMARAGLGEPFVVLNPGQAAKEAARFRQYIANPVLTGIKVSYEGFPASEVEPQAVPDLFALRPLTVLGKYRGSPTGTIVVRGQTAKGPYEYRLELKDAKAGPENAALRLLWARQRIMNLVDFSRFDRKDQTAVQEVASLGLKYSLMTPYTSFVAVDQVKRADGQVVTVKQPLPLPEGVSDLAVGGSMPKAMMPSAMTAPSPSRMLFAERKIEAGRRDKAAGNEETGGGLPEEANVKLTIREFRVKDTPAAAAIQQALEAELPKLLGCCQDATKTGGKLPEEITVAFTIGLDGKVTGDPKFTMTAPPKGLENCLAAALKGIRFSSPLPAAVPVTVIFALTGN